MPPVTKSTGPIGARPSPPIPIAAAPSAPLANLPPPMPSSRIRTAGSVTTIPARSSRRVPTISMPSAVEVIAQKLGLIIHAEQDMTGMDIGAMIEAAIRGDMAERRATIAGQRRAIDRAGALARADPAQSQGRQHAGARARLARILDRDSDRQERGGRRLDGTGARDCEGLFLHRGCRRDRTATRSRLRSTMRFIRSTSLRPVLKTGPAWCDLDIARPSASG